MDFDRLTRIVSPFTLLIGALLFLLPFCTVACNSPLGGTGNGNVLTASGANLVTGADVTPDCGAVNQALASAGSSIANRLGGSAAGSLIPNLGNLGSACSNSSSGSSSSSGSGLLGGILGGGNIVSRAVNASNTKLGPFGPSSSANQVHVDRQPWAIAALALLVLGALFVVLRGRIRPLLTALAAVAAAVSLILLRTTVNSSFNDGVGNLTQNASDVTRLIGLDLTNVLTLSWGVGWALAVVAAVIAAGLNFAALLVARTTPAAAPAPAPAGGPPPGWGTGPPVPYPLPGDAGPPGAAAPYQEVPPWPAGTAAEGEAAAATAGSEAPAAAGEPVAETAAPAEVSAETREGAPPEAGPAAELSEGETQP